MTQNGSAISVACPSFACETSPPGKFPSSRGRKESRSYTPLHSSTFSIFPSRKMPSPWLFAGLYDSRKSPDQHHSCIKMTKWLQATHISKTKCRNREAPLFKGIEATNDSRRINSLRAAEYGTKAHSTPHAHDLKIIYGLITKRSQGNSVVTPLCFSKG